MPVVAPEVLSRDWSTMMGTMLLFVMAYEFRGERRIKGMKGALLLVAYLVYNTYLAISVTGVAV